jgi:hypothetical protein
MDHGPTTASPVQPRNGWQAWTMGLAARGCPVAARTRGQEPLPGREHRWHAPVPDQPLALPPATAQPCNPASEPRMVGCGVDERRGARARQPQACAASREPDYSPVVTPAELAASWSCHQVVLVPRCRCAWRLHGCVAVGGGGTARGARRTPFSLPPRRRRAEAPAGRSRSHDSGPLGTADGCLRPTQSHRTAGVARSRRRSNIASASARVLADDARRATERLVRDTYDLLVVPLRTRQPSPIAPPPVAHYLPRRANTGLDTVGFE